MTKRKSTKRALLLSALSLLMCVSMLIGSTFAWFTDSVTSGKNIIAAGNLDVELYHENDEIKGNPKRVDENEKLFTDVALWEPGAVAYEKLNVKNVGSLALKYALSINVTGMNGVKDADGVLHTLTEALKVAVVDADKITSREAAIAAGEEAGWDTLGNWTKSGKLYPEEKKTAENPSEESCGVVIYWLPTADDNLYNLNNGKVTTDGADHLHIDLGVHLVATQLDAESDSFGTDYDKYASAIVTTTAELRNALNTAADGAIVIVESGTYEVGSVLEIKGKNITVLGMGNVNIVKTGGSHLFNVSGGSTVTFENLNLDGKGLDKNGIYVRNNCDVTLKNVVIKNTGGKDILVDEASDAAHGKNTTSTVTLRNSHVEDVGLCASPASTVPEATQDTFVLFNYLDGSTVGSIDVQDVNIKPQNIKINGVAADKIGQTMLLNVKNDAELAAALSTIKSNSAYWNKEVIVNLAAGEYKGNHVIPQYPEWNGVVGAGTTDNNMAALSGNENTTVITFVGETVSTMSLRGAQTVPAVIFTGNVTVEGWGNAGNGFTKAAAFTTFENVAFDAANSIETNGEDYIALHLKAAANNVTFKNCVFENATHIGLGTNRGADSIGKVDFMNCTMNEGGCLSGYVETLTVKDTTFTSTKTGFIDKKKAGSATVENCVVDCAIYFLRTDNKSVKLTVKDTTATQFDVPNSKGTGLVVFRGSEHTASFIDCDLTYETRQGGAGTGELEILNYSEENGVTYCTDAVANEKILTKVSANAPETLVVPEGVTALGNQVFGWTTVKNVTIPASVTDFGCSSYTATAAYGGAFKDSAVEKVVLSEGITEIPNAAFNGAKNLKEVEIPTSVKTIGINAFAYTAMTSELVIPANVTHIDNGAFRGMTGVETIIVEGNPVVDEYAFRSCPNLTTIKFLGADVTFTGTSQLFCRSDNGANMDLITLYVANEKIAERVAKAQGSAKGYKVVCGQEVQDGGYYTDTEGNAYAYDTGALKAAIDDGVKDITLSSGEYQLDKAVVGVTIKGVDEKTTLLNAQVPIYGFTGKIYQRMHFENLTLTNTISTMQDTATEETGGGSSTFTNVTFAAGFRHGYGSSVVFTDCTFGSNSEGYALHFEYDEVGTAGEIKLSGCKFEGGNVHLGGPRTYAFTNCEFAANTDFQVWTGVTLDGCTVGGVEVTAANVATLFPNLDLDQVTIK